MQLLPNHDGHVSAHTDLQNIKELNLSGSAESPNGAHSSIQTEADFIIDKSDSLIQSLPSYLLAISLLLSILFSFFTMPFHPQPVFPNICYPHIGLFIN